MLYFGARESLLAAVYIEPSSRCLHYSVDEGVSETLPMGESDVRHCPVAALYDTPYVDSKKFPQAILAIATQTKIAPPPTRPPITHEIHHAIFGELVAQ